MQKSGHVDDDVQISVVDAFFEMDGRKSRYIREVLNWYRGEDAGDLKRSELNELVENMTCLNALAGEMWIFNLKIVTMNPEMQTTLLNTYPPKLIATILMALRDQLTIVEEIAEIPREHDQIWKEGGRFWDDVNGGSLSEDIVLTARREETDWVHSDGVFEIVPMQECQDVGMKPWDLIWVDTDKSVDPTRKNIRSRLCAREYKTKKQGKIQRALPASSVVLCKITSSSCEGACLNHDVTLRQQQSTFPRNSPGTHLHQTSR